MTPCAACGSLGHFVFECPTAYFYAAVDRTLRRAEAGDTGPAYTENGQELITRLRITWLKPTWWRRVWWFLTRQGPYKVERL